MEKYHKDVRYYWRKFKRRMLLNQIQLNFSLRKKKAELPLVSRANQGLGEASLVKWIAESLCPFLRVRDKGFQEFVQFFMQCKWPF